MRVAALLASVALIAAPAHAQIANTQVTLDDSFSELRLQVDEAVDVGGTAIAGGNAMSADAEDADLDIRSTQSAHGASIADAEASVNTAYGAVSIMSAAVNNGLTAATVNGSITSRGAQHSTGDATAATDTWVGNAGAAASSASAGANVATFVAEQGDITSELHQDSAGSVSATTDADACCVNTAVVADAIASANNITATGSTTTLLSASSQESTGASVTARSDLSVGYAVDAISNATANGNALTVDNQWGYANVAATQRNTSDVRAQGFVTLGGDFLGTGSAAAYGVGNSAVIGNLGSDTLIDVAQDNAGSVSADSATAGLGGEYALASSAAYGNVITGALCGYCDASNPGLTANGTQTNSGDVHSSAVVNTPYSRTVAASASAIGNAASYHVQGQN